MEGFLDMESASRVVQRDNLPVVIDCSCHKTVAYTHCLLQVFKVLTPNPPRAEFEVMGGDTDIDSDKPKMKPEAIPANPIEIRPPKNQNPEEG